MKLLLMSVLLFSQFCMAKWDQLPAAKVDQSVLGGDVLLINMKEYLVINGMESAALVKELGSEAKNNLMRDLVMTKSTDELISTYKIEDAKSMTNQIILRYSNLILKMNQNKKLN